MKTEEQFPPTIFVIFGGAGDLSWRKLVPALFDLSQDRGLPKNFAIIAVDRMEMQESKLRKHFHDGVKQFSRYGKVKLDPNEWNHFAKHIYYHQGDFNKQQTYLSLGKLCNKLEKVWDGNTDVIYYMATPPMLFGIIPVHLHTAGLTKDEERSRLVIEKPLGHDLESAKELNRILLANFNECQIFRIDHYLGKETVQNLLALRFANPMFEPIWNRRYVDFVAITVAEELGIEHRGGYYDQAGALRDMVQNHLMQLLCLVAMEPMVSFDANEIRNKKLDVLHAVTPITHNMVHDCVVRGQYCNGWSKGEKVPGYREEEGVSPTSETETFVALKLAVDNWRWQGVPFYMRTGKRLPEQISEIVIQFRKVPHQAFPPEATLDWQPARLIITIQPREGIILRFQAKHPGPEMHLNAVDMHFNYQEAFDTKSPDAYETLLWDIMKNDPTQFMRADQVEAAWQLLMPILEMWKISPPGDFPNYRAGTWGPEEANQLLSRQGHSWPCPTEASCPNKK